MNLMKKKELREQNRINMINELRRFGDMDIDSVFSELGTQREGLSIVEIEDKLDEFGENNIDYLPGGGDNFRHRRHHT